MLRLVGFEEGKRRLAAALAERLVSGRELVTCRQILHEAVPEFIKENILLLAQRRLKQEKPFSWNPAANFDINDAEVRAGFEKLLSALVHSMRLTRSEVERCIQEAVVVRLDALVRPQAALETYLFNPVDSLDKKLLLRRLDLFGPDMPFVFRMKVACAASEESEISKLSFALKAKEIAASLYSYKDKTTLLQEFDLLINLFKLEEGLLPKGVDVALVEEFIAARGLDDYLVRVRKKAQQGKTKWLREDFQDIFEFSAPSPAKGRKPDNGVLPKIVFSEEEQGPVFHAQREHQPPGPYPSIQTLIDSKDYKILVQKLFSRDERAFRTFIDKVDQVDKWREAKQLIDWELNKRRLDPYCKEAVKLGDIVFAKYFNNSGYM